MRTKIITLLLAIIADTNITFAATKIGDFFYTNFDAENKEVTLTKSPNKYEDLTIANIPATVVYNGVTYNVAYIDEDAFHSSKIETVTIPNSVISIGLRAFYGCSNLTDIDIPNSVTYIGLKVCQSCSSLKSARVGHGVTSIKTSMFSQCPELEKVTIGNNIQNIDMNAFNECTNLKQFINYSETPASVNRYAFSYCNITQCTLYVPRNSIDLYKNADKWCEFYKIEAIEDVQAIDDVAADKVQGVKVIRDGKVYLQKGEKTYTMQGQEVK